MLAAQLWRSFFISSVPTSNAGNGGMPLQSQSWEGRDRGISGISSEKLWDGKQWKIRNNLCLSGTHTCMQCSMNIGTHRWTQCIPERRPHSQEHGHMYNLKIDRNKIKNFHILAPVTSNEILPVAFWTILCKILLCYLKNVLNLE